MADGERTYGEPGRYPATRGSRSTTVPVSCWRAWLQAEATVVRIRLRGEIVLAAEIGELARWTLDRYRPRPSAQGALATERHSGCRVMASYNIACVACGKPFEARRRDAQVCSKTCSQRLRRGSGAAAPGEVDRLHWAGTLSKSDSCDRLHDLTAATTGRIIARTHLRTCSRPWRAGRDPDHGPARPDRQWRVLRRQDRRSSANCGQWPRLRPLTGGTRPNGGLSARRSPCAGRARCRMWARPPLATMWPRPHERANAADRHARLHRYVHPRVRRIAARHPVRVPVRWPGRRVVLRTCSTSAPPRGSPHRRTAAT